jgi:hypothetical protein
MARRSRCTVLREFEKTMQPHHPKAKKTEDVRNPQLELKGKRGEKRKLRRQTRRGTVL